MLWNKRIHTVELKGGRGQFRTEPMSGLLQHLAVTPKNRNTVWSMDIKDSQNDTIFQIIDHEGRLDDKSGLPVGSSKMDELTVDIYDTTSNEKFFVMFKVKEAV